ncbi:hypothetical protein [Rhizobium leguminosarum]|uniref:hypothetical protein n=1 Tax=Rhizobium leguminosarum TaxID=384 RepID=UPI001C92A9E3|nr:hypothetical protein [Rhizobium leguminosarum]MBY2907726.1 hypothetical protein [Rhizobium leguminosarum]
MELLLLCQGNPIVFGIANEIFRKASLTSLLDEFTPQATCGMARTTNSDRLPDYEERLADIFARACKAHKRLPYTRRGVVLTFDEHFKSFPRRSRVNGRGMHETSGQIQIIGSVDYLTVEAAAPDQVSTGNFAAMALDRMRKRLKRRRFKRCMFASQLHCTNR